MLWSAGVWWCEVQGFGEFVRQGFGVFIRQGFGAVRDRNGTTTMA